MRKAGQDLYKAFLTAWDGFWIVWLADVFFLGTCLFVVTIPLAFAGLFHTMRELAYGEPVDWKTFFVGIKKRVWAGYRWFFFNLLVGGLLVFYMWFFSAARADWGTIISGIPAGVLVLWLLLNLFTLPMMMEQVKPSYLQALRNSLVFFLKWPGYTFGFTLVMVAILALSIWLRFPIAILGASLPALLACTCIMNKTEEIRSSAPAAEINKKEHEL